jgi:1-acyl-sn-glycerol-3-phosphate acyltransferase
MGDTDAPQAPQGPPSADSSSARPPDTAAGTEGPRLRVFEGHRKGQAATRAARAFSSPDALLVRLQTLEAQVEEALTRSRLRAGSFSEDLLVETVNAVVGVYAELRHRAARANDLFVRFRMLARGLGVDDFGYDPAAARWAEPLLGFLFRRWWRVEVLDVERVPARGPVMLVANHGGALLPYDALMIATALRTLHPAGRQARPLVEDYLYHLPHLGTWLARMGAVRADRGNARRLLGAGAPIIVFPEGQRGLGKPYGQRYHLQRFGRGGFVSLCLETRAPLVPVSVIGAEEAHPVIARAVTAGRLLGLPYLPITPTFPWLGPLGLLPLPSKWTIRFGEPIDLAALHDGADPEDPALVGRLREEIRQRVQRMVLDGLRRRRSIFFG